MKGKKSIRGFSLIELLVSLVLFTIVIVMAVGTLLILIDANAKAQNMQEVMTNLTFALDSMTREIRTGRGYYCSDALPNSVPEDSTRDCDGESGLSIIEGGSSLTEGAGSSRVAYRFEGSGIERKVGTGPWLPLTSEDVVIEDLSFTVDGSDTYLAESDTEHPTVMIVIEGQAGTIEGVDTGFVMQTTITKRLLDI